MPKGSVAAVGRILLYQQEKMISQYNRRLFRKSVEEKMGESPDRIRCWFEVIMAAKTQYTQRKKKLLTEYRRIMSYFPIRQRGRLPTISETVPLKMEIRENTGERAMEAPI